MPAHQAGNCGCSCSWTGKQVFNGKATAAVKLVAAGFAGGAANFYGNFNGTFTLNFSSALPAIWTWSYWDSVKRYAWAFAISKIGPDTNPLWELSAFATATDAAGNTIQLIAEYNKSYLCHLPNDSPITLPGGFAPGIGGFGFTAPANINIEKP